MKMGVLLVFSEIVRSAELCVVQPTLVGHRKANSCSLSMRTELPLCHCSQKVPIFFSDHDWSVCDVVLVCSVICLMLSND